MNKSKLSYLLLLLLAVAVGCTSPSSEKKMTDEVIAQQLPDPLQAGWKGESVCEVVEENEKIRVLKCTFAPRVGHERHYHDPHVGYTIAGGRFQITDSTGTRTVDVPTGSSFSKDKVSVHEVLNVGETTAEFLIIEYK